MEVAKESSLNKTLAEKDEDLLIIISWREELDARNEAFTEFHRRYINFIYSVVSNICKRFPNSYEMSKAISNNVLCNVYDYSGSFNSDGINDPVEIRKRIEGWLISIAKTELKALLTNYKIPIEEEQLAYKGMMEVSAKTENSISFNEKIVAEAFSLLRKERDKHILMTYWMYYEKGKGSQAKNMPEDVLDELAERYETTKLSIRQIISRSNKIVKEHIENNYKLENNVIRKVK
jgi:hypothetical protein